MHSCKVKVLYSAVERGVIMAKNLDVVLLADFYGEMLTENQRRFIEYYYNDDLSLSEIAQNEGITRQGVRDAVKRAEKAFEYGFITESELNAFKESVSLDALNDHASTAWYGAIKKDIELSEKITRLQKEPDFVLPGVSDIEESEEVSENAGDDRSEADSSNAEESQNGMMIPVIIGILCALVIAAVVIFIVKKK